MGAAAVAVAGGAGGGFAVVDDETARSVVALVCVEVVIAAAGVDCFLRAFAAAPLSDSSDLLEERGVNFAHARCDHGTHESEATTGRAFFGFFAGGGVACAR